MFQRYLNVFSPFDLVNRSRDYPSNDHRFASFYGVRSRPPSVFNVGFSFLISITSLTWCLFL